MFNTPVEMCMALVVDPDHPRYGQSARILLHDWQESGDVVVAFSDGQRESLHDGGVAGDPSPQVLIFKRNEANKLQGAVFRLWQFRENLQGLKVVAGDGKLPLLVRQAARESFFNLVLKGEPVPSFS